MKIAKLVLCMVCLAPGWLMAEQAKVTEVLSLEGSIVMQVKGGNEVTLTPGRASMKVPTIFILSAETQAKPKRQSSWCSW